MRISDWSSDVCSSDLDHRVAETAFMVMDMVREAQPVGDRARVANILPGAAGADALSLRAMIIELQRHADDLGARARGERGADARVYSTRHGDDHSPVFHRTGQPTLPLGEPGGRTGR